MEYEQVFGPWDAVSRGPAREDSMLESHIRDLQTQLQKRDDLIDKLRDDVAQLHEEHRSTQDRVGVVV